MYFVLLFKGSNSWRCPENVILWTSLWDLYKTSLGRFSKNLKLQNSQLFREIENNAMKMHLYERFKIDTLWTSQERHSKEVFSRRFENGRRTFLLNCKNK